jgi:SLT domain-containing protein
MALIIQYNALVASTGTSVSDAINGLYGDATQTGLLSGNNGYAEGTDNATKGIHLVAEKEPELVVEDNKAAIVDKPMDLNFEGGGQVIPFSKMNLSSVPNIMSKIGNIQSAIPLQGFSTPSYATTNNTSVSKDTNYHIENVNLQNVTDYESLFSSLQAAVDRYH